MSKTYGIFVRNENAFVPVDKVTHDYYYSDCNRVRKEMQKRGSCCCSHYDYWYCNMECGTCKYCRGNVNYKESLYTDADEDPVEEAIDETADIQQQMERKECAALLWQLYDGLSEEEKYMYAQLMLEQSHQNIADELGIPRTTMISRLNKSRAVLQKKLKDYR